MSDEAATNFQSELLTLEPSCEEDPSAALIGVDSAFTAPLNARGLRVVAPATCASTKFAVVSDRMRLVNCSDGEHVCGAAAGRGGAARSIVGLAWPALGRSPGGTAWRARPPNTNVLCIGRFKRPRRLERCPYDVPEQNS